MAAITAEWLGFFDESGTHQQAKVLAVGGWVAAWPEWEDFEYRWNAANKKHGVEVFRFSDCDNSRGEFKDWKAPQKIALMKDLFRVIDRHEIYGFCAIITMDDYKRVVQGTGSALEQKHSPYVICEFYLFELICKYINHPVRYILEEQPEFKGFGRSAFWETRDRFPQWTDKMVDITYRPKPKFAGLQAADLLVYETAKSHHNRLYDPTRKTRESMVGLLKAKKDKLKGGWLDEKAIRVLLEWNPPTNGKTREHNPYSAFRKAGA